MPLERLIYRSLSAIHATGSRSLIHYHDIVSTARRNNETLGVSGFLMFDRTRFYQILEGETADLDDLFGKISRDNRHSEVECLSREQINARLFPDWSMATLLSERHGHPLLQALGANSLGDANAQCFLRFAQAYMGADSVT